MIGSWINDRYRLDSELGRGGMGIVFLAREVALDRMVALKLLPPEMASRPGMKGRFLQEARTAARLSHPNIVPIYTTGEAEGCYYYAMEFVEGVSLDQVVARPERLLGAGAATAVTRSSSCSSALASSPSPLLKFPGS